MSCIVIVKTGFLQWGALLSLSNWSFWKRHEFYLYQNTQKDEILDSDAALQNKTRSKRFTIILPNAKWTHDSWHFYDLDNIYLKVECIVDPNNDPRIKRISRLIIKSSEHWWMFMTWLTPVMNAEIFLQNGGILERFLTFFTIFYLETRGFIKLRKQEQKKIKLFIFSIVVVLISKSC